MHLRSILARATAPAVAAAAGVALLPPATGAKASLIDHGEASATDLSIHTNPSIHTDLSLHTDPSVHTDQPAALTPSSLPSANLDDDTSVHSVYHSHPNPKTDSHPDAAAPVDAISDAISAEPDGFRHALVSGLLVGFSLACAVCFPDIDAIFGLLGGTTSVVLSFVAPAIFWQVQYEFSFSSPPRHPSGHFLAGGHVPLSPFVSLFPRPSPLPPPPSSFARSPKSPHQPPHSLR
jgi:hypothetical protein